MLIDIHTHTFPDALAPRAIAALSAKAGVPTFTDGTCSGLCNSMQQAGIDLSVIAPVATSPGQVRKINADAAAINKKYNQLISLGALHPDQQDWAEEIDRMAAEGIQGVKFHPDYQRFFVDEERIMPIYRKLAEHKLIVLFHAGVDIGLPPPVHCTPDRLAHVLDLIPDLQIIAAHMGGYECWDEVELHLIGRNIYLDTSYSLEYLGSERMAKMIRNHGTSRVLFGTDSPWKDQAAEVAGISNLALTDNEKNAILGDNAMQLLSVSVPPRQGCSLY